MIDTTPTATWVIDIAKWNIPSCREFNSALNGMHLEAISLSTGQNAWRNKTGQKNL